MGSVALRTTAPLFVTNCGCAARTGASRMRRSWRVGVRRLLHLICLRCGQANAADAKFCGECGGALLRKFCADCHAINDAQAHFCRSGGAALPAQPPAPVSASDEAAPAHSAIEVAYAERAPAHVVTPTPLPLS